MRAKAKVSSFEPRRLQEALKELERIESVVSPEPEDHRRGDAPPPKPGLLVRWWRWLLGSP